MQLFQSLINFILHIDKYLLQIVNQYGMASYAILFAIIFMETGLVVTPFLPGDSLLFVAAFLGDTVNYWIGRFIGPKAFNSQSKFLKKEYLEKAQAFYEKHGGKAIVLARFVPIVRTFAPFVAGIGKMHYTTFLSYNLIGGIAWVLSFTLMGFFFGNLPIIRDNFHYSVFAIVGLSLVPMIVEVIKSRQESNQK